MTIQEILNCIHKTDIVPNVLLQGISRRTLPRMVVSACESAVSAVNYLSYDCYGDDDYYGDDDCNCDCDDHCECNWDCDCGDW